ncbi:MAG: hypothetical protein KKB30_07150 [Proteobacteria bacterium]|nr:hypothetical protein [Pseudomonadota bacterium]MBU1714207.1 hypothetical protein [Pseudomonadota bacterium]
MSRIMNLLVLALLVALCQPTWSRAEETPLNRQDVTVIKKKLVEVAAALGQPPSGYGKAQESYDLPTSINSVKNGGGFRPVYASANLRFDGGGEKMGKKSEKEIEAEYNKKILEAQATGNYQAMAQLVQEMMQKASQAQIAANEAKQLEPVDIYVRFNNNSAANIDPDAVVFESPGVIALKASRSDGDMLEVSIYFDPVKLKDTQTLSRIDLSDDGQSGSNQKTTVRNITIEMTGPAAEVEAWSKQIATAKVLAQIDK